jgi:hypothetical protein
MVKRERKKTKTRKKKGPKQIGTRCNLKKKTDGIKI